ncbi:MAG TPA: hypothetical protein VJ208_02240 [Candidatus Nanoarchaeia archaeon]|nr:hypothetical protein [Candidatus Nanoarchaeia archaeon]
MEAEQTDQLTEQLKKYLKGEMSLKNIMAQFKMSKWEVKKILAIMFAGKYTNHNDNNYLYEKRMDEVEKQRAERFTEQEISTQIF